MEYLLCGGYCLTHSRFSNLLSLPSWEIHCNEGNNKQVNNQFHIIPFAYHPPPKFIC